MTLIWLNTHNINVLISFFKSNSHKILILLFFTFCSMTANKAKASVFQLNTKQIVQDAILDVKFISQEKKTNIKTIVYFIDKEGLNKFIIKNKDKNYAEKIQFKAFKATKGQIIDLTYSQGQQIILVGIDKEESSTSKQDKVENVELTFAKAGANVAKMINTIKGQKINILFSNEFISNAKLKDSALLVEAYFGFNQRNYKFDKYLTDQKKKEEKTIINNIVLDTKETKELKQLINKRRNQLEGIFYVRSFGNEPANVLYPESFANEIEKAFAGVKNTKVKILNKKNLEKLGMNMLLGVAQGSAKEPKVVVIEYLGNSKKKGFNYALIGKGVCFDSGGLSLKPSPYMEGMKGDMIGAATVLSSTLSLAKNGVKENIVAIAGLVENMPDGNAQKVGDIVRSMSGKTVEIIDTDAEGRLVLGDILYYAQSVYKPKHIIDVATLTGAIMVALGTERAGVFTNDKELGDQLYKNGEQTGDRCWIMPLGDEYQEAIKSNIADIRNLGKTRYGGSATAAAFLENFIDNNDSWAHIDIAGVDNATASNDFGDPDLASGFGVKLLNNTIENNIRD